jgi:AcrR family transcriptional regulator
MKAVRTRAVNDTEKLERRAAILAAAEALVLEQGGAQASVAEVAERTGIAKGTVYLYFRTREEIFLGLHEQWMGRMFDRFDALFAAGRRPAGGAEIGAEMADAVLSEPHGLMLASTCHSVMETHIELAAARDFKLVLAGRLRNSGALVESAFTHLEPGSGARLLVRAYAMTLGLRQLMDTSSRWRELESLPGMEVFRADYGAELEAALVAFWSGALDGRTAGRRAR